MFFLRSYKNKRRGGAILFARIIKLNLFLLVLVIASCKTATRGNDLSSQNDVNNINNINNENEIIDNNMQREDQLVAYLSEEVTY